LAKKEETLDRPLSEGLQLDVIQIAFKSNEYCLTSFRNNLNKMLGAVEGGSRKCVVVWGGEGEKKEARCLYWERHTISRRATTKHNGKRPHKCLLREVQGKARWRDKKEKR
jgi:hypothetical protein